MNRQSIKGSQIKDAAPARAVVFGLFETGLGVARSLGQKGIAVTGVDFRKDVAWYSRYVRPLRCPHPVDQEQDFTGWLQDTFGKQPDKPPVFFTSDEFLAVLIKHRDMFSSLFRFNMPSTQLLTGITDKYQQFLLAMLAGVDCPETIRLSVPEDLHAGQVRKLRYPVIIKALDVNRWRSRISQSIKGYVAANPGELAEHARQILEKDVAVVVQEVVPGPDTNHYKYCCYIDSKGVIAAEFSLRKIRQNPVRFGVGSVVESIHYPTLTEIGRRLFTGINYSGIGSAEFKLDERDQRLKLIEINPRYWQQNYLATACGVNFPLINHADLTGREMPGSPQYQAGVKWVNPYMDLDSYLTYRSEGLLGFRQWRRSLKGRKVYADFTWDDPVPSLYEIRFGRKILNIPVYLWKRLFR